MKVICKKRIVLKDDIIKYPINRLSYFNRSEYDYMIQVGMEYTVMGIMQDYYDSKLLYYLIDDGDWYPCILFDITDNSLPDNWFFDWNKKFKTGSLSCELYFISGFYELCNSPTFYIDLIEGKKEAFDIFYNRKVEMEKDLEYKKLLKNGK